MGVGDRVIRLCPACRKYVGGGTSRCIACGWALSDGAAPLELVLEDGTRVALVEPITIGRAPRNSIRFTDPSVSREHARILAPGREGVPVLEDVGSSFGTWLDDKRLDSPTPLRDGASIRVGDCELIVERRREPSEAGRTIVVRAGTSLVVPITGGAETSAPLTPGESKPRVRGGWALKRMEATEGSQRWVLRHLSGETVLRLGEAEAELFRLMDGSHSLVELIRRAEQRSGSKGAAILARLIADLGEHGLLAGVEGSQATDEKSWLSRLLTPRVFCFRPAGSIFRRLYRAGGYRLFTRVGLLALSAIALVGLVALAMLIARRYGTPFVVADNVGLGGLAFIVGRVLVVFLHELAHALTLIALGRGADRSGVKFILGFPYAFVDTTEALFEPRRRRLAVSASGPLADLVVGGGFALACLAASRGTVRDVFFQVALSAYVGALFNLNPLLDRDGYHLLVDLLGAPNLRRRAREWLAAGGRRRNAGESRAVSWYAIATIVWSLLIAGVATFMSLRYEPTLTELAPKGVAWSLLGGFWALVLIPAAASVMRPVVGRSRQRKGPSDEHP